MIWDEERWLPDQPRAVQAPRAPRPKSRRRRRDWLASGVMVVAMIGLVIPIMSVSAGTGNGRALLARWSAASDVSVQQESSDRLAYRGDWFTAFYPDYLKGQARSTDMAGASVGLKFRGAGVSWIGPIGPTRGSAKVFVDGKLADTVSLYASAFRPTRVLFKKRWDQPGSHRIRVVAIGTAGHPTVAVDAFVIRATTGDQSDPIDDLGNPIGTPTPTPVPTPTTVTSKSEEHTSELQ